MKFTICDGVLTAIEASSSETSLAIPEGVTEITRSAFQDVPHIRSLRLPDSVAELHPQALRPCAMLTELSLPARLALHLEGCINQHLILRGEVTEYPAEFFPLTLICPDVPIKHLPAACKRLALYGFIERYKEAHLWKDAVYEANHAYARQNEQRIVRFGLRCPAAWYYLMDMHLLTPDHFDSANTSAILNHDTLLMAALMNYREAHLSPTTSAFDADQLDAFDQEMEALINPESDEQKALLWKFSHTVESMDDLLLDDDSTCSVSAYQGTSTSITYPRIYREKLVTKIRSRLAIQKDMQCYRRLRDITVPSGYTHIGENAFAGVEHLKRLSLPVTIQTMETNSSQLPWMKADEVYITQEPGDQPGGGVLRLPSAVRTIVVQDGVKTLPAMTEGMSNAFSSLRKLVLPMSLEHIVQFPALTQHNLNLQVDRNHPHFYRTSSGCLLTRDGTTFLYAPDTLCGRFELPDTVRCIAPYAFCGCGALTAVVLPNGLEKIGAHAFEECRGLLRITLPDSVTHVGEHCFHNCIRLAKVHFGASLAELGSYAFHNSAIRSAHLPDTTAMADGVFSCCNCLKDVHLPDTLLELPRATFDSCTSLRQVALPPHVTHIAGLAFRRCFKLTVDIPGEDVDLASTSFIDAHRCRIQARKGSGMYDLVYYLGLEYTEI